MKKSKKFLSLILLAIWLTIIFLFSSAPSDASNEQSKNVVNQLIGKTSEASIPKDLPTTRPEELENKDVLEINEPIELVENEVNIEYLNYLVRKIAHISEYFILALLVLNVIYNFKNELKLKYYIITICSCFAYAITDEVHQIFVPRKSRTS